MYFDELKLGMTVETAPAIIDKQKMLEFARDYDDVPLHTDEEYAKTTHFGKLIAPGVKAIPTPELREMDLGAWVGHTTSEIAELFPDEWRAFRSASVECRATDGESRRELLDRIARFFRTAAKRHDGQSVLVVTHGGALRAFFLFLMGGSLSPNALLPSTGNTGISTVRYDPDTDRWRLIGWNDTAHLDSLMNGDDVY